MGNTHTYLVNLDGNPSLITSMTGGNFAINGDANVSFGVANLGSQGISAHQYNLQNLEGDPSLVTSFTGGNFAINGNGNVCFNVQNGGDQEICANQSKGRDRPRRNRRLMNLDGDPSLITSMTGGNFAINGDANVAFTISNGRRQRIRAKQNKRASRDESLMNLDGDPSLVTSFTGGNYAINGNGNVSFNIGNGGHQNIVANQHKRLMNLDGDPSLITSFTGGNYAINGDANVSFGVYNGGHQSISANQHKLYVI